MGASAWQVTGTAMGHVEIKVRLAGGPGRSGCRAAGKTKAEDKAMAKGRALRVEPLVRPNLGRIVSGMCAPGGPWQARAGTA